MESENLIIVVLTASMTAMLSLIALVISELVKTFLILPLYDLWKLKGEIAAALLAFRSDNLYIPFEKTPDVTQEYQRLAAELRAKTNSTPLPSVWEPLLFCRVQALEAAAALKHLATWRGVGAKESHLQDFIRERLRIKHTALNEGQQQDLYRKTMIPPVS